MSYKLIAVDMDGTLLDDKGNITPFTAETVNNAIKQGVLFSISTGRAIQGVYKYKDILNLNAPIISYNGAMVVHPQTKQILFEKGLCFSDAKKVLELGNEYKTTMCIWSDNQLYGNVLNDKIYQYKKLSGVEPMLVTDYEALLEKGITKILWYDEIERIKDFQNTLQEDSFYKVTFCTSQPYFLEFFNSDVSKGKALEFICNSFDISQRETIAIGDGLNDLSMIEYAALGVAMENAHNEVKSKAQYVTLSNNQEGVAHVINKFILKTT